MRWQNVSGLIVTTDELLDSYTRLDASDYSACNILFGSFGPGNVFSTSDPFQHVIDKPYERLAVYEHILHELKLADSSKYNQMHKGTPFFFISWLSFSVKDFEKAIFYMDSAISEDIRASSRTSNPNGWQTTPAADFLLLDPNQPDAVARSIMQRIQTEFQEELTRFNTNSGASLQIDVFRSNFVKPNIQSGSFRSIISGLYAFIMEYSERNYMLRLKSGLGGSIEPFLIHLFKGCLIFESLLKTHYSGARNTLGDYLANANAIRDLEIKQGIYGLKPLYKRDQPSGGYTLPMVLSLLSNWRTEDYKERIVATTFAIRNTAGHDLSWPISFDEATYGEIYEAIIQAILWFIWKVEI